MTSILVIEDHPLFVQSLVRLLRDRGQYDVTAVASAEQALEQLPGSSYDLALVDVDCGVEVVKQVLSAYAIPVVATRAVANVDEALSAAGSIGYPVPFSLALQIMAGQLCGLFHGYMFDTDKPSEVERFRGWLWMNTTTLAVFFIILGGILFTYFASLAGYSAATIYNMQVPSGIKIATILAEIFKAAFGQFGFILFIIVLIFALFDSQFSVYDGIARMFADVVAVETHATNRRPYRFWYFLMMGILCAVGMITVWMRTPYILWVIINWAGVAVHAALTLGVTYLNFKLLPGPIKPKGWIIVCNVVWAIALFIYFAAWTIYDNPLGLKL